MVLAALLGCAHIHTPGFIKRLQARSDIQVKSVWDHDAARARLAAENLGASVVNEPDALWSDAEVGAVIICSETVRHSDLVLAGAAAKKHMFVEKPLGVDAAGAYEMADAIETAGVIFQTGYFMRGNPANRFVREQIAQGAFGTITRVRTAVGHSGSLGGMFDTDWRWMADTKQAGLGGFGDLGTHALDLLLWLMGDEGRVESVTATIGRATSRYGDTDEYGEGQLRFANGAVGTLGAGWVDLANPFQLLVSGTRAHAHVIDGALYFKSEDVEGADGAEPWTELPEAWPHAFELFLDAVTGVPDVPLVTPREAALRSAVMEAMYHGAEHGTWLSPVTDPSGLSDG
ncbi:MAG: Gfo/Idh/MocA family oxidoreductase [Chloroflexota bacterium]|nr:Gfo/Idh/MocA family oxidoreductase [Chloroflexota bacterium]